MRSKRLTRLFEVQEPISLLMSERFIGRDLDVLVYSVSEDGIASATAVCGRLVRFKVDGITEGDNATVHITGASSYELTGEIRK
jgi:tRNA A37 methylthiotransferase MiaB